MLRISTRVWITGVWGRGGGRGGGWVGAGAAATEARGLAVSLHGTGLLYCEENSKWESIIKSFTDAPGRNEKGRELTCLGKYFKKDEQWSRNSLHLNSNMERMGVCKLTFRFCRFLDRVELPADILQPPLQLPPLLQSQLLFRLASAAFLCCCAWNDDGVVTDLGCNDLCITALLHWCKWVCSWNIRTFSWGGGGEHGPNSIKLK